MKCELTENVLRCMATCGLPEGSAVVVAFSGGPDSLCLLETLVELTGSGRLDAGLVACHVDHMLRPCSGSDAEFCRKHAQSLGVPFELRAEDVGALAACEGLCLEDAARRVRYRILEEVADRAGARVVVTGHNLDDQAETVIMRILRGAGLTGLCGIRQTRPVSPGSEIMLVRPLLEVSREKILSYLKERNIRCLTDETNTDTSYLRNRIRAHLLPLLEERYSPAIRGSLARLARSAGSALEFLESEADRAFAENLLENSRDSVKLDLPGLRTSDPYMLYEILKRSFGLLQLPGILTAARFEPIARAIREGRTSGRLQPGAGASVEFQDDGVLITRLPFPSPPEDWEVELRVPGVTPVEMLGVSLVSEIVDRKDFDLADFKNSKSSKEEALDADAVGTRLAVRPAKPGDSFRPLGLGGTKKVADFLTDWKVPLRRKVEEAVVTAGGRIAWLLGRRLDGRFAVVDGTRRVLLISAVPGAGSTRWQNNRAVCNRKTNVSGKTKARLGNPGSGDGGF